MRTSLPAVARTSLAATADGLLGSSPELLERLARVVRAGAAARYLQQRHRALARGEREGFLARLTSEVGGVATVLGGVGLSAAVLLHGLDVRESVGRLLLRLVAGLLLPVAAVGVVALAAKGVARAGAQLLEVGRRLRRDPAEQLPLHALALRWDRVLPLLEREDLRAQRPLLLRIATAYLPHLAAAATPPALLDQHLAVIERWSVELGLAALDELTAAIGAVERGRASDEAKSRVVAALLRISERVDGSRGPMR